MAFAFLRATAARDACAFDLARELATALLDGDGVRLTRQVLEADERFVLTNACELAEKIVGVALASVRGRVAWACSRRPIASGEDRSLEASVGSKETRGSRSSSASLPSRAAMSHAKSSSVDAHGCALMVPDSSVCCLCGPPDASSPDAAFPTRGPRRTCGTDA